jgi:hypothetical protein
MVLYLRVLIVFSLRRESLKLILVMNPSPRWFCHARRQSRRLRQAYRIAPVKTEYSSPLILLDAAWTTRVSNFGLSLIMGPIDSDSDDHHSHSQLPLKVAGTVGYMDPEYYGLHHLTIKSDVYGFGVIMLESLTRRCTIFKDTSPHMPELVAPHKTEAVELIAYTVVHCIRLEGKNRSAMADIVTNLKIAFTICEGSDADGVDRGGFGNSSSSVVRTGGKGLEAEMEARLTTRGERDAGEEAALTQQLESRGDSVAGIEVRGDGGPVPVPIQARGVAAGSTEGMRPRAATARATTARPAPR